MKEHTHIPRYPYLRLQIDKTTGEKMRFVTLEVFKLEL